MATSVSHTSRRSLNSSADGSGGSIPKLPEIEHPLTKLRRSQGGPITSSSSRGFRPLAQEDAAAAAAQNDRKSHSLSRLSTASSIRSNASRCSSVALSMSANKHQQHELVGTSAAGYGIGSNITVIPESVEVVDGNPDRVRLPLFGNKADLGQRSISAISHTSCGGLGGQLTHIQEIELVLKEKMKNQFSEMRRRFVDNDPEGKGAISREAFSRVVQTSLGREMDSSLVGQLFSQLGLPREKQMIHFSELLSALNLRFPNEQFPKFMDPIQRHQQPQGTCSGEFEYLSAAQAHKYFRDKLRRKSLNLADIFPNSAEGSHKPIGKAEFKQGLRKMVINIDEGEFEKLWKKYDTDCAGAIELSQLMRKMGILLTNGQPIVESSPPASSLGGNSTGRALTSEINRERSIEIELFIKDKLREGFKTMKAAFEAADPKHLGHVTPTVFLQVLQQHGLNLEMQHLNQFAARCAISVRKDQVPYREFLHRFQDRSEAGMPHKVLVDGVEQSKIETQAEHALSSLEQQLINMFQKDFITLLSRFRNIDRYQTGVLSQEEFRAVIESQFNLDLTMEQFRNLIDNCPLDRDGLVLYNDFLKQFDTSGITPSLFSEKRKKAKASPIGGAAGAALLAPPDEFAFDDEEDQAGTANREEDSDNSAAHYEGRSHDELKRILKDVFMNRFAELERTFYDQDVMGSNQLTQESMYQLLKKLNVVQPEISRGEIRHLWKCFIVHENHALDYKEFLRFFMHDQLNAAFPNAKIVPPRKGDSDLMIRSRKLNADSMMLQDSVRSKIDFLYDQLRAEFIAADPQGEGIISLSLFQEILKELCIHLNDYELDSISKKFCVDNGSRISYVELLRPFAYRRQPWRTGNDMLTLLQHPKATISSSQKAPRTGPAQQTSGMVRSTQNDSNSNGNTNKLEAIMEKMGKALNANTSNMKRAFRKMDGTGSGLVPIQQFRTILNQNVTGGFSMNEEEVFQLLSAYDPQLNGQVNYQKLLKDLNKGNVDS